MKTFTIATLLMLMSSFAMADCSSGKCTLGNVARKSATVVREVVSAPVNLCRRVVSVPSRVRHHSRCRCR